MTDYEHLTIQQQQNVAVVALKQPNGLDAYHITDTAAELYHLVEKEGRRRIALDLSSAAMLSSQSLGVFLTLQRKLASLKGRLALCGINPGLYRVFKVTKLDGIFMFFADIPSALEGLNRDDLPETDPSNTTQSN